jgi:hypothetical protein
MKRRTLRGQVIEGDVKRLIVDDGRLTNGYRVTKFVIAGDPGSSANDAYATLSLDYDAPRTWNWGDNRQIAWASTNVQSTAGTQPFFELVDPNHVVLQDLYIQAQVGSGTGSSPCNYLIVLEPMELTNDEAILTLIKERSQDDPR